MKYERIKEESREYKYGPGEEFETKEKAKEHVLKLKNQILNRIIQDKMNCSIEEMNLLDLRDENAFKLSAVIKYPIQIFSE